MKNDIFPTDVEKGIGEDSSLSSAEDVTAAAKPKLPSTSSSPANHGSAEGKTRRYLIHKPRAHQWFAEDVLFKRSDKERAAGKFELFFDLLYVALLANFAEHLAEHSSGADIAVFIIIFCTAWHAWADHKELMNNYYNDDIIQRAYVLWIMSLLLLFGNNANYVAAKISYLRITTATYQIIRFSQACMFLYNSFGDFRHRTQNRCYVACLFVVILLWTPMYTTTISDKSKLVLSFIAIAFEEFGYVMSFGPWIPKWLRLTHRSALDINHENDRYTAFTIIVLGEFVYSILVGSPAKGGLNIHYLHAVLTLILAFCFNAMYTYQDGAIESKHPARRNVWTAAIWLHIHLPMSGGLLIAGHVSASTAYHELDQPKRWLFGGGLALGYGALWIMALLFQDCDEPKRLVAPKFVRILPRLLASIISALLPLASHHALNDTALMCVFAAVAGFVVIWETVTSLERGSFCVESWKEVEN